VPVEIAFELPDGRLVAIAMDATLRETHTSSAVATEHPVEEGTNISDHVRAELPRVEVEAFVTNTPIRVPRSRLQPDSDQLGGATGEFEAVELRVPEPPVNFNLAAAAGALYGALFPAARTARVLRFSQPFNRVVSTYDLVSAIVELGTPVLIVTALRSYENMVIENLTTPREAATGDAIAFTFAAKQIRTVASEIVAAPDPIEERGRRRQARGGQQTEEAEEGGPKANRSLLMQGLEGGGQGFIDAISGLFG